MRRVLTRLFDVRTSRVSYAGWYCSSRIRTVRNLVLLGALCLGVLWAVPMPFRVYLSLEPHDNVPLPPDYQEKTEWVFARLMYPPHPDARFTRRRLFGGPDIDWRQGGTSWSQD